MIIYIYIYIVYMYISDIPQVVGKAIYQKGARWVTIGDDYRSWYAAIAATQASMLNEPAVVYSWWCSADNWAGALGAMGALCQDNNVNLNMRIDGALKNGMVSKP